MYSKLKCCVKFDGHFSNFFTSNIGLMQGEYLSPLCLTLCKLENIFGNCVSFVKDEFDILTFCLIIYSSFN
jgi:hypothetical protein